MRFSQKQRRVPVINIISLIDILCILLIFFIVTTVFKKDETMFDMTVPPAGTATNVAQGQIPPTTLYLTKEGKMYLGAEPVEPSRLADMLKARIARDPKFKLALKADEDAPFKMILKINDAASQVGLANIPTYAAEKK
ncbi:MAG: ExbD/TolR family protein [Candidatus Methylacidiphilales bacterium]|nr:biopolymer transporter ExbD [Candidatus Methylacidiphilales bacterium]